MDQENIMVFENQDESYTMTDLYLYDRFFGHKDSYNYYDFDVDKILLFKKSDKEYIIRYNNAYKMTVVPLKLKTKNCDDKEHFRKIRDVWSKIIEIIGINNPKDFVENTINDDADKFILVQS